MRLSRDVMDSNPGPIDGFLSVIVSSSFERLSETHVFDMFSLCDRTRRVDSIFDVPHLVAKDHVKVGPEISTGSEITAEEQ